MPFLYIYIGLIVLLTFVAIILIVRWGLEHRPKHSPTVALRNLQHDDSPTAAATDGKSLTDEQREGVIRLIGAMNANTSALGTAIKRGIYLLPVTAGTGIACLAPNPLGTRMLLIALALIFTLLLVFAVARPIIIAARANKQLSARFERWAQEHPELSEKATRHRDKLPEQDPW